MTRRRMWCALALVILATARCENAGEGRVLAIQTSGIVKGSVYLDRNGNRVADAADTAMRQVRVRLIAQGTLDTTVSVLSDSVGAFRVSAVPVGSYAVSVDTATFGDSVRLMQLSASQVTVQPAESVTITARVSYPSFSVKAARALTVGRKIFLEGVVLSPRVVFGDTTGHLADTSGAIRITHMRASPVGIGDSVRLLGLTSTRDGQPTLDDAIVVPLGAGATPIPQIVSTLVARTANAGALDAGLVFLSNVIILDTATVPGSNVGPPVLPNLDFRLFVDSTPADTSDRIEVLLDGHAGFSGAFLTPLKPDSTISVSGVLVPVAAGRWRLKPRVLADVVP
jgi:hypothetical protein